MAINIDIQKQTQLSGLQHPYPRPFQQAGLALAQAGRGLQNIGTDIGNFALAEQEALQKTRSQRILANFTAFEIDTANKLRDSTTADEFEPLYNKQISDFINTTLNGNLQTGAKGLPDGAFKTSVAQLLEAKRIALYKPIASEGRLRRLKSEKAGVEETIELLQQQYAATFGDLNPASESIRASLEENIDGLIQGMSAANLIDPDDAVRKRQKAASDLQLSKAKFLQRTVPEEAIEYLLSSESSAIEERVRQDMIKSTDAILVRAANASARQEEKDERANKALLKADQDESYAILIAMASKGKLTAPQVSLQLETHAIRGPQGTSLIEFIGKYPDGISDPKVVEEVERQLLLNPGGITIETILAKEGLNRDDSIRLAKDKRRIAAEPQETKDFKDGKAMILNIYKQDPDHWADEKEQYKIVAVENYKKLVKEGRTPFLAAVESINNLNIALNKKEKDSQESPISVMGRNRLLGRMKFGGDNYVDAAVRLKNNIAAAKQENEGKLPDDQKKFFKQQQNLLERIKKLTPADKQVLPGISPTNNNKGGDTAKEKTEIPIPQKPSEVNIGEQIKTQVEEFVEPIKDGLRSLGLLRGPMFALDLNNFTTEDILEELKRLESYVARKGEDAITKLYKNNLTNKKKELEQTKEN